MDEWMVLRRLGHDMAIMAELVELRRGVADAPWAGPAGGPFG
jgi:hypothetical protein